MSIEVGKNFSMAILFMNTVEAALGGLEEGPADLRGIVERVATLQGMPLQQVLAWRSYSEFRITLDWMVGQGMLAFYGEEYYLC